MKFKKLLLTLTATASAITPLVAIACSNDAKKPTNPGTQTPGTQTPGTQTPGTQTPGNQTPGGGNQSGTENPTNSNPGNQNPGGGNQSGSGTENPSNSNPEQPNKGGEENNNQPSQPTPSIPTVANLWNNDEQPAANATLLDKINFALNKENKLYFAKLSKFYDLFTLREKVVKAMKSDSSEEEKAKLPEYQAEFDKVFDLLNKTLQASEIRYNISVLKGKIQNLVQLSNQKPDTITASDLTSDDAKEKLLSLKSAYSAKAPRFNSSTIDQFLVEYKNYYDDLLAKYQAFLADDGVKKVYYSIIKHTLSGTVDKKYTFTTYRKYQEAFKWLKDQTQLYSYEEPTVEQATNLINEWNKVVDVLDKLNYNFNYIEILDAGTYGALIVSEGNPLPSGVKSLNNIKSRYSLGKKGTSFTTINDVRKYYNEIPEFQGLSFANVFPTFADNELSDSQKVKYLELQLLHNKIVEEFFELRSIPGRNEMQYVMKNNIIDDASLSVAISKLLAAVDYVTRNKVFDEDIIQLIKGDESEGAKLSLDTPEFQSFNYLKNTAKRIANTNRIRPGSRSAEV
ncbi:hypothetical protein GE118_01605 [Mycoplasma sp. NEAQ87857]|uniref:proline-rich domain-containing protein n=1 Tax=Mycoplasma sp. NEAQ87857 TaxID=2683967 RepID=UPI0013196405|nr:hypothetical protein [Mycoplasma sp. NEAQ87857]QGZ97491.1 hypothetical protein GE118_01605 [Mycoplasma sp. NEAQ87857]